MIGLFLVILWDKAVSFRQDSLCIRTLASSVPRPQRVICLIRTQEALADMRVPRARIVIVTASGAKRAQRGSATFFSHFSSNAPRSAHQFLRIEFLTLL